MRETNLTVEYRPIDTLRPYKRALRKNNKAVPALRALINEFGFRIPLLIRGNGEVIDGELRLKAARELGMTQVPVLLCDDWTEEQVRAFRLAVNRSATYAEFDLELVALEMLELKGLNFDLQLTGFTPLEIDRMIFQSAETPDSGLDAGPGGSSKTITKLGDVWVCCGHRILCGDSTSKDAVATLLKGSAPVLLVTDPPYGVSLDPEWREEAGLGKQRQVGKVANDDRVDWAAAYELFPGDVAYVWHAGIYAAEVAASLNAIGFAIRAQIIWVKQHFAMSRGDFHWQHEPCFYCVRRGKSSNWSGDRTQSTVWQVANLNPFGGDRDEEATGHGAQKPVEVMRRPILNNTRMGESVYDPFLGSGTTLIAAELTDRACLAIDIEPRYVDMAVKRWQKLTGKQAVLAEDGSTFDEIAVERRAAAGVV
jgi:DNA modification methylase